MKGCEDNTGRDNNSTSKVSSFTTSTKFAICRDINKVHDISRGRDEQSVCYRSVGRDKEQVCDAKGREVQYGRSALKRVVSSLNPTGKQSGRPKIGPKDRRASYKVPRPANITGKVDTSLKKKEYPPGSGN